MDGFGGGEGGLDDRDPGAAGEPTVEALTGAVGFTVLLAGMKKSECKSRMTSSADW